MVLSTMNSDPALLSSFVMRQQRRWIAQSIAARLQRVWAGTALVVAAVQLGFWMLPWTGFPLLWDLSIALGCALSVAAVLDAAVFRAPSPAVTARRLERAAALPHPLLSIALDLGRRAPGPLSREALRRAAQTLGDYPPRHRFVKQPSPWLVWVPAALCAVALAAVRPSAAAYWRLPFDNGRHIAASIRPGTIRIPRNSPVVLSLTVADRRLPSCACSVRDLATSSLRRHLLRQDSLDRFSLRLDSCASSFAYVFSAQGTDLNADTVYVVPPPTLYKLQVSLAPPAYTGIPAKKLGDGQGSFEAYAGTAATWAVGSTAPLGSAEIVPLGGDPVACAVERGEARASMTIVKPLRYTLALVDSLGQRSDTLPTFYVDIIPDLPPLVHILQPGRNRELAPEQAETLLVEAVDDLGIRRCAVEWRKKTDTGDTSGAWDLSPPRASARELQRALAWDLKSLRLYPGDTVFYWATARDSKPFGAPQIAVSDTFWFRVPTFGEIQRSIARSQETAEDGLAAVLRDQDRLKEELGSLLSSAKDGKRLSWEEKQAVADVAQQLTAQRDSLQKAVESLREMAQQLRDQGMSNRTLLDKMDKVRESVEDLVRRYGDSLLFQAPRTDETVQWQDLRNALKKLESMLPTLEERLDNTLQYLAMLRRDQDLASLAARAEDLGRREKELAESDVRADERLRAQRDAAQEQEKLLGDIRGRMQSDSGAPMLSAPDVPSLPQAQGLSAAMRREISQNRIPQAETMNRMSGSLMSLAEELRAQLSSSMVLRAQREAAMLLDMTRDALALSEWQEQIRAGVEQASGPERSRRLSEGIRAQEALRQALSAGRTSLDSLSMVPPDLLSRISRSFDQAAAAASDALSALGNRGDAQTMGRSTASLNALAQQLLQSSSSMNDMMQGQSGQGMEGMMCGLRKLSGKQAAVNAATGEMLRMMLGGQGEDPAGSAQAREDARRSAQAAQQGIADRLRELAEKYGKDAGGGTEGRVNELEEEARKLTRMLHDPAPEVKDRQDRFLVRMLQTALSMHRQDEGNEERKSTTAARIFTPSGPVSAVPGGSPVDRFYRLRAKALRGNFPRQYRRSVEAYLDSLEAAAVR